MAVRPWMPLYIGDYLADTTHLGALQSGAYLHLIMHYWLHGKLPAGDDALMRIARLSPAEWKREKPVIAAFFHDGWRHKRIDAELAHASDISSKRSTAAHLRHSKDAANAEQKPSKSHAIAPPIAHANAEQLDTHARASSQSQSPLPSQKQEERSSLRSESRAGRRETKMSVSEILGEEPPANAVTIAGEPVPDLTAEFDQFWDLYPHKTGKPDAHAAFIKARKGAKIRGKPVRKAVDLETILTGLDRYKQSKPDDRQWLNPTTFLNGERYNDEPAVVGNDQKLGFGAIAARIAREIADRDQPGGVGPDADRDVYPVEPEYTDGDFTVSD